MLNFCSLYSGSTGNCLFVQGDNTNILVDAGVSGKKILEALKSLEIDINSINAILVTHEHIDHVRSIGLLSQKYNIPVYATEKTWEAIPNQRDKINSLNRKTFKISEKFEIGNLNICGFSIPHDAIDPCGFNIYYNSEKISIATDLGHINNDVIKNLENSSFVVLESNYDLETLRCSPYPYYLKQRISGPNGHLSNTTAGKTISHLIKYGLKNVMLAHLSKENNFPELAYETVLEEMNLNNYEKDCINLFVATRLGPTKLINVC